MNIVIAEPLSPAGIELLQSQKDWNVIVSNSKEYASHLADADALLVRSAVEVNADVLAKAPKLRVIGRAGVGVDTVDLDAASDYITFHVSLTPETERMLSRQAFGQMKTGVRIVNCARGELLDEEALREALESGKVASAALDVFAPEPPAAGFPLFKFDTVIATPHIGGSTEEAQEIVGIRIAEQVVEYLKNGVAINAVNMPALSPEQYKAAGPFIDLAGRLGNFAAHLISGNPTTVRLTYYG